MAKISPSAIIEGVGALGIIFSLIFVGLQMQQSSEIAIAGQYQERMALSLEYWNTQIQIEGSMRDIGEAVRDNWLDDPRLDHSLEDVEIGQKFVSSHRLLALYDNLHFQYGVGILPERAWEPYRTQLRNELRKPVAKFVVRGNTEGTWRVEFLDLCKELEIPLASFPF